MHGGRPFNIFPLGEPVELTLTLTGLNEPTVRARLQLYDRDGKQCTDGEQSSYFDPQRPNDPRSFASEARFERAGDYYQGVVSVFGKQGLIQEDATSLVIAQRWPCAIRRPIPATSSRARLGSCTPNMFHTMITCINCSTNPAYGVSIVRYGSTPKTLARGNEAQEIHRATLNDGESIGVIDATFAARRRIRSRRAGRRRLGGDVSPRSRPVALPGIEPILLDLAFKVRGWQLGDDHDLDFRMSLRGPGGQHSRGGRIRSHRTGRNARRGLVLVDRTAACRTTGMAAFGNDGDARNLPPTKCSSASNRGEAPRRTTLAEHVGGFPRNDYSSEDRAADLVDRVMAAKTAPNTSLFFIEPFHTETGLLGRNGEPGELYLPWRTITAILEGAQAAGSCVRWKQRQSAVLAGATPCSSSADRRPEQKPRSSTV